MSRSSHIKEAIEVDTSYEEFYTGGRIEWSKDGSQMFCQCSNKINIVSLLTGLTESTFYPPEEEIEEDTIYTFAVSKDNVHLVTAHKSGLIKLWSVEEHKVIKLWRSTHKGPIAKLTFDESGQIVATGGSDGTARLWDIVHQTCTSCLRGSQGVFSVLKFHPDANTKIIFGAADDTKIRAWEIEKGEQKHVYTGHFSKITSLNITYDGTKMVSSGRDRVLILWDIQLGKALRTLPVYESLDGAVLLPIKFTLPDDIKIKKSSGGIYVACAGEKGVLKVWDVASSKLIYTQQNSLISPAAEEGTSAVTQVLFNEITYGLCVVSAEHNIFVYDLSTFACTKQMIGYSDEILDIVFLGKDDTHVAVATNSNDVKVFELNSMNCRLVKGHTDLVLALSKSTANPNLFLSSAKDNTIRVWLMNENHDIQCIGVGSRHTASVGTVCMPNLCTSYCLSASQDTCLKKWQLPEYFDIKEPVTLIPTHTEIAHPKDINCVCVSPNDKIVATGSQDKSVKLWSSDDLSLLGTLRGHKRGVWCVRFSPVDQVLLSTSADCSMKLWSLAELNCLKTFDGHDSSVLRAEFISKGLQIISAGADGLLKLWNLKTSECTLSLDKHDGRLWALAVSQDEDTYITGGADSLMIKWKDVTADKRIKDAKEREEMILQEQELSNLLHDKKMLKALRLALRLDKPHHVLKIINEIIKDDEKVLMENIEQLSESYKEKLLKCCVEWNTNTKNCQAAQVVIHALLKSGATFSTSGGASSVRALLPYTHRHMQRLTGMMQDLHFLQYTVNCMQPHDTKIF